MKTQLGAAMVEFALIALLFFILLFGVIEFARAFFTYNTLVEATRRGARVAAVCPISAAGIKQVQQVTVFDPNTPDGTTTITGLFGLATTNVAVSYYDDPANKDTVSGWFTTPLASDTDSIYGNVSFVRVAINSSQKINLFIPGFSFSLPMPTIQTTLPSQSLGRDSYLNPVTRCCYNLCP